MTRDYPRLPLEEFGRQLLMVNDLDPVYNMLHRAKSAGMGHPQLKRWCLAYWCFYNSGLASWLSEKMAGSYWDSFREAAENITECPVGGRWPRGRERRHFRGAKCIAAVESLRASYASPEAAVDAVSREGPFNGVREQVIQWPMFGPWIAFKVGDMVDRVLGIPVEFASSDVFFFDTPRKAAEEWFGKSDKAAITAACDHLAIHVGHMMAPPDYERVLNLQEFETILCKWHSHRNGFYPIGIDTHELKLALEPWSSVSPTAEELTRCL